MGERRQMKLPILNQTGFVLGVTAGIMNPTAEMVLAMTPIMLSEILKMLVIMGRIIQRPTR